MQVEGRGGVYRCEVCGRLTSNPIFYKTCCTNKPAVFCSEACARKWIATWMRNQEQQVRRIAAGVFKARGTGSRLRKGML